MKRLIVWFYLAGLLVICQFAARQVDALSWHRINTLWPNHEYFTTLAHVLKLTSQFIMIDWIWLAWFLLATLFGLALAMIQWPDAKSHRSARFAKMQHINAVYEANARIRIILRSGRAVEGQVIQTNDALGTFTIRDDANIRIGLHADDCEQINLMPPHAAPAI